MRCLYLYINNTYCANPEDVKKMLQDLTLQKSKAFRNEFLAFFRDGVLKEWYEYHGVNLRFPDINDTDEKCFKELVRIITGNVLNGNISSPFNEIGELLRVEFEGKSYAISNENKVFISVTKRMKKYAFKVVFKCLKAENNDYKLSINEKTPIQSNSKNWKSFNRGQEVVYDFSVNKLGVYCLKEGGNNILCDIKIDEHEYVDLGLPSGLKWATCNIGANKPEALGDRFAWGETDTPPSNDYSEDNCSAYGFYSDALKKNKVVDSNGNLTKEFDVATQKWGDEWRMPSRCDFNELIRNCAWNWDKQNGVEGYKVTGKNGNSIFLPATDINGSSSYGQYWSSTDYGASSSFSWYFYFHSSDQRCDYNYRYVGFAVRPVCSL